LQLKVPILFYHKIGVAPPESSNPHQYVPPENFAAQMKHLWQHGYQTLTLSELGYALHNGVKLPRRSVVITFDDGHHDNYEHAFPILERYGLKAIIFIVADFIGRKAEWQSRETLTETLLSWQEILEMQKRRITFASHTCTHPMLNKIPIDQARYEIAVSRDKLEQGLGAPVESFCYPYGEYNREIVHLVIEAGYTAACITDHGNCHLKKDVHTLKRVFIWPDTSLWRFIYYLSSLYDYEQSRKRRRKSVRKAKKYLSSLP
jgi:peptidoglycan/xylan/chitin deacetylase (PgdA/CDA1 family)